MILVVEDSRMIRMLSRDALEDVGLSVIEAGDGRTGLNLFLEQSPDLVLLDVNMPELDGFAVCEAIRSETKGANVPIVMMTASDDLESIKRAYEAGATDFAAKPVNWAILSHRVRYMLRMSQALNDLARNERRLADAQRAAKLGYWELNLRSGHVECSEEVRRLYGFAPEAGSDTYQAFLARIHCNDRPLVLEAGQRSVTEQEPFSIDHRVVLADDEQRCIHLQAQPVLDESGHPFELSGTAQDITDRKRDEAEIRFLAYHDNLTGLGNRRLFTAHLRQALAQARRDKGIVAVLFVDLDHFKRVNDTLGHSAGDLFLKALGERLKRCVRETDCVSRGLRDDAHVNVSRFGGDEFIIALSSITEASEAAQVATRILTALSDPVIIDDQPVVVRASIGIAIAPNDGDDVEVLIQNADAAMYQCKNQGRGTFQFYEHAVNELSRESFRLEADLRRALENEELRVHYQPKIEIATGRISGFEALVRWTHPERGVIPPDVFVPLAEKCSLIEKLSGFVLRAAAKQVRGWIESGLPAVRVGVNISAREFGSDSLVQLIEEVLRETSIDARYLEIEITETAMIESTEHTARVLERIKQLGVTVALDDFGTGYSSLTYLRQFPVDVVKIDRSFVRDIHTESDDASITAAIISMAHELGLRVVAEGVETEEQLDILRGQGCEEMQGYLFSRPLPEDEATELLRSTTSES